MIPSTSWYAGLVMKRLQWGKFRVSTDSTRQEDSWRT